LIVELFVARKNIKYNMSFESAQPFIPPITQGVVVKVYDGDTITIVSKLPYPESPYYKFSVRLNGIDCAEIKGKTANEKTKAKEARDVLSSKILNQTISLRNVQTEKYGRILADVYLDDIWINEWMIINGFAVAYDGGTKARPDDWA